VVFAEVRTPAVEGDPVEHTPVVALEGHTSAVVEGGIVGQAEVRSLAVVAGVRTLVEGAVVAGVGSGVADAEEGPGVAEQDRTHWRNST